MRKLSLLQSFLLLLSFLSVVPFAQAADKTASLSLTPASGGKSVGDTFTVSTYLNTGGQAVGAVDIRLTYSNNLQYVKSDATGSVFNTEVTPPQDANNIVRFARTRFDTGYDGTKGLLIKITFKATAVGAAKLTFAESDSQVIAYNDSSNILKSTTGATFSVTAATSPTSTATPKATAAPTTAPTATLTPTPLPSIAPTPLVTVAPVAVSTGPSTVGRVVSFGFLALAVVIGVILLLRRLK